jgi:probable addiction module antidote protein
VAEKIKITKWSVFDDLKTDEDIAGFLEACIEDNDYEFFTKALGIAVKARGINATAKKLGVPRDSLYKDLSGAHKPNFETVFKAIDELGFRVHIVPYKKRKRTADAVPA